MIPPKGDLLEIIPLREGLPNLHLIKDGHLHFIWKENELISGWAILKDWEIKGAYVEYVSSKKEIAGDTALAKIIDAINSKKVKTIEIYKSSSAYISQYLNAFPTIKCVHGILKIERAFESIEDFLDFLEKFNGELILENSNHQWILEVYNGEILEAVEYSTSGQLRSGDDAVKSLMKEMPKCLPSIKVEEIHGKMPHDGLKKTSLFREGLLQVLSLLLLKKSFEGRSL